MAHKSRVKVIPKKKQEHVEPSGESCASCDTGCGNKLMIALIAIILLAGLAFGIAKLRDFRFNGMGSATGDAAAIVNGETISMIELDEQYEKLPPFYKVSLTKDALLSQLINERLLLQKAKQSGIVKTDEEAVNEIDKLLLESGRTQDDFQVMLDAQNMTKEEFVGLFKDDLIIRDLVNTQVLSKIVMTEEVLREYYDNNSEIFLTPESINVSHIIICSVGDTRCRSNRTKDEALEAISAVKMKLTDENFAELAMEYSDEPAAKTSGGSLGIVSKYDQFDETFLEAAFSVESGKVSDVVETQFGYHLIKILEKKPEATMPFDEVVDQLNQTMSMQEQQKAFQNYISDLREDADIKVFLVNATA